MVTGKRIGKLYILIKQLNSGRNMSDWNYSIWIGAAGALCILITLVLIRLGIIKPGR